MEVARQGLRWGGVDFHNLAGFTGAGLYLWSYFLLSVGRIDGNGLAYSVLNLVAAILVMISLTKYWNAPSAVIQAAWILCSIYAIFRMARRHAPPKGTLQ